MTHAAAFVANGRLPKMHLSKKKFQAKFCRIILRMMHRIISKGVQHQKDSPYFEFFDAFFDVETENLSEHQKDSDLF